MAVFTATIVQDLRKNIYLLCPLTCCACMQAALDSESIALAMDSEGIALAKQGEKKFIVPIVEKSLYQ